MRQIGWLADWQIPNSSGLRPRRPACARLARWQTGRIPIPLACVPAGQRAPDWLAGRLAESLDFQYDLTMVEAVVELLELRLEGEGWIGGRVALPPRLSLKPGQYLLANAPRLAQTLPAALFPSSIGSEELLLAPPLPPAWLPGVELSLRGPQGKGFHLPASTRRLALGALDSHPYRLLPLLAPALAQGLEIAIFTPFVPPGLPPEVEVLPASALADAPAWADYLALDLPFAALAQLRTRLGLQPGRRLPCQAEVLVVGPMPCCGLASCGVCAVKTRPGWKFTCLDGPVFDIDLLEI